jgi:hypothetical protein
MNEKQVHRWIFSLSQMVKHNVTSLVAVAQNFSILAIHHPQLLPPYIFQWVPNEDLMITEGIFENGFVTFQPSLSLAM